MPDAATSFASLRAAMARQCATEERPIQSLANLDSALKAFTEHFGLTASSPVGSTMRSSFHKHLAKHITELVNDGRSSAYIANRKSALKRWRGLVLELDRAYAANHAEQTPFQAALRTLFEKGHSQRAVAQQAGVALASLKRWLKGATPNGRARTSIRRLEVFFGLSSGALIDLVYGLKHPSGGHIEVTTGQPPAIAYRTRLAAASKDAYRLQTVQPNLQEQWAELVIYKTAASNPGMKRHRNARWSAWPAELAPPKDADWHSLLDGQYIPTASIMWQHVAQYLGWLVRPKTNGGAGLGVDEVQSLAWLVRTQFLERYIRWRISRSKVVHGGIGVFLRFIRSLTHPQTGYLFQRPELLSTLPPGVEGSWDELCAVTHEFAKESSAAYARDELETSRNPFEPLAAVLALQNPLDAVSDMLNRMKADRPLTAGKAEALWARDCLLVKLLATNPLRAKNLKQLRYFPDNTGNFYQKSDGSWHVRIPKRWFKNFRGAARHKDYDMPIPETTWRELATYLRIYRPILAGADNTYVFVSSREPTAGQWERLNRRIQELTRQYLWKCPGVGPHGFRHIVATAILKMSPNDWQTAADVLHDLPKTVEQHYAHLRSSDGAIRMHKLFGETLMRM